MIVSYKSFTKRRMCRIHDRESRVSVFFEMISQKAKYAFKALAQKGINIRAITTSEIKISVLIEAPYTELAVRTLHSLYGLDSR